MIHLFFPVETNISQCRFYYNNLADKMHFLPIRCKNVQKPPINVN